MEHSVTAGTQHNSWNTVNRDTYFASNLKGNQTENALWPENRKLANISTSRFYLVVLSIFVYNRNRNSSKSCCIYVFHSICIDRAVMLLWLGFPLTSSLLHTACCDLVQSSLFTFLLLLLLLTTIGHKAGHYYYFSACGVILLFP